MMWAPRPVFRMRLTRATTFTALALAAPGLPCCLPWLGQPNQSRTPKRKKLQVIGAALLGAVRIGGKICSGIRRAHATARHLPREVSICNGICQVKNFSRDCVRRAEA